MKRTQRRSRWWLAFLGLAAAMLSGCQTWVAGMTLPSPHYLEHSPQFFPPSPPYPHSRELAFQERIAAAPEPGVVPIPAPVVPPVGP
jgi:hypothetical protein